MKKYILAVVHIIITFIWIIWIQWWYDFTLVPIYFSLFILNIIALFFIKNIENKNILLFHIFIWISVIISRLFRPWSWDTISGIDVCSWFNLSREIKYGDLVAMDFSCLDIDFATNISDIALSIYSILSILFFVYWITYYFKKSRLIRK